MRFKALTLDYDTISCLFRSVGFVWFIVGGCFKFLKGPQRRRTVFQVLRAASLTLKDFFLAGSWHFLPTLAQ